MSTFINLISEQILWWPLGAIVFGILMVIMGIQWEKSGKTEALRKAWMLKTSKLSALLLGLSASVFVFALVIRVIRAIAKG